MRLSLGLPPLIHHLLGLRVVLGIQYPEFGNTLGRGNIALADGEQLVPDHASNTFSFQRGFQQLKRPFIGRRVCAEQSFHSSGFLASLQQLIVLVVSTDPKPDDGVIFHDPKCAVVVGDSGRPKRTDLLELDGRITGILDPQAILFERSPADFQRESPVERPISIGRTAFH